MHRVETFTEDKKNLQQELDYGEEWLSIKQVAKMNNVDWKIFDLFKLKIVGMQMGYGVKRIFDANYGEVNAHHRDVWKVCYPEYEF